MRNQKSPQVDTTFKSQLLFKNLLPLRFLGWRSKFSVQPTQTANVSPIHSPLKNRTLICRNETKILSWFFLVGSSYVFAHHPKKKVTKRNCQGLGIFERRPDFPHNHPFLLCQRMATTWPEISRVEHMTNPTIGYQVCHPYVRFQGSKSNHASSRIDEYPFLWRSKKQTKRRNGGLNG